MKKVLLVTASLIALGAAAPALAADLAARPYTKAPAYVAAVYDWSGFYIGANGGWVRAAIAGTQPCRSWWALKVPTMRPVALPVVRSAIAGRPAPGCSARSAGRLADLKGSNISTLFPGFVNTSKIDGFGLFTGQVGYAAITSCSTPRAVRL